MFTKSVLFSSLLALAMGKPIGRRDGHLSGVSGFNVGFNTGFNVEPLVVHEGARFDLNSVTVKGFNPEHFSFNNFGGLASLNHFDNFFGQGNFCGVQNVLVQKNVVTCQITQVNIVQQHLAIIAEYAKRVILTRSCETEAQVLLYTQFLGGLTNWGQTLRRVNGIAPTFDVSVANQIVNVVDIRGDINVHDFGFVGSTIGSHGVTVTGDNWLDHVSPSTVGFVWEKAVLVAGPSVHIGVISPPHVNNNVVFKHGAPVKEHHLPTIVLPPVVVHESIPSHKSSPIVNVDPHATSGVVFQKGVSISTDSVDVGVANTADVDIAAQRTADVDIAAQNTADVDIAAQNTAIVDIAAQNTADVDVAAQTAGDIAVATGVDAAAVTVATAATDAAAAASTDAAAGAVAGADAAAGAAAAGVATPPAPQVSVQPSAAGVLSGRRLPARAWDSRHRA